VTPEHDIPPGDEGPGQERKEPGRGAVTGDGQDDRALIALVDVVVNAWIRNAMNGRSSNKNEGAETP
jgi:hypothetical protein